MNTEEETDIICQTDEIITLNTDIVLMVLSYLDVTDWVRLETVSKQFQICVNFWFRRQKNIAINSRIGINQYLPKDDIIPRSYTFPKNFLETHSDGKPCLIAGKQRLLWMADKLPNIVYLALNHFDTNFKTLYQILETMPSLHTLFVCGDIGCTIEEYQQLGHLLSPNIHKFLCNLCGKHPEDTIILIRELRQLTKLIIHLNTRQNLRLLFRYLPETIRSLRMWSNPNVRLTHDLAEVLVTNNGRHLNYLYMESFILSEPALELIINQMTLKAFGYKMCREANQWHCLQRIAQTQPNLSYLSLISQRFVDFDETRKQFPTVTTLLLLGCYVKHSTFECLLKCFPSLRTLILWKSSLACDLREIRCQTCAQQMYHLVAKHTNISRLVVYYEDLIGRTEQLFQTLVEFKHLRSIHIKHDLKYRPINYTNFCREFIDGFIGQCDSDWPKVFTIRIFNDTGDLDGEREVPKCLTINRSLY